MLPLLALLLIAASALWLKRIRVALRTLQCVPEVPLSRAESVPAKISILMPARNEEENLRAGLPSLLSQTGMDWECLVANDRSEDDTEKVLLESGFREISACAPASAKRYLNIKQAGPASWTGKNYALAQLAPHATGDWLLFTDADTLFEPSGMASAAAHAEKHGLDFLSLLPRCIAGSALEKMVQPSAMGFLGLWIPLDRVNDPADPLYFANGQFLLIRKTLYERLGGHAAVAEEFLEDFALMRKAKACGARAACHFGQKVYGTRMYQGLGPIWRGWRRIYRHAARDSAGLLGVRLCGVFYAAFSPVFALAVLAANRVPLDAIGGAVWLLAFLAWGFMTAMAAKTHRLLGVSAVYALFHPLAALLISGILADALRLAWLKRATRWRG